MTALGLAWGVVKILSLGSLGVGLAGVVLFGWTFVKITGRAAKGDSDQVPNAAWRGGKAGLGLKLIGCGAAFQVASIVLAACLPGRL